MKSLVKILVIFAVAIGMGFLVSLPVYWLWNWLMPKIFGLTIITFWEALGLSVLCSLLFKNSSGSNN